MLESSSVLKQVWFYLKLFIDVLDLASCNPPNQATEQNVLEQEEGTNPPNEDRLDNEQIITDDSFHRVIFKYIFFG